MYLEAGINQLILRQLQLGSSPRRRPARLTTGAEHVFTEGTRLEYSYRVASRESTLLGVQPRFPRGFLRFSYYFSSSNNYRDLKDTPTASESTRRDRV